MGCFAQADTIVPAGVQGYDRYAYVNNNPVRYTDPTGHMMDDGEGGGCSDSMYCTGGNSTPAEEESLDDELNLRGKDQEESYQASSTKDSHWQCVNSINLYDADCELTLTIEEARKLRDSYESTADWLQLGFGVGFTMVGVLTANVITAGVITGFGIWVGNEAAKPYNAFAGEITRALESRLEGQNSIVISISRPSSRTADYEVNAYGAEPVYIPYEIIDNLYEKFD